VRVQAIEVPHNHFIVRVQTIEVPHNHFIVRVQTCGPSRVIDAHVNPSTIQMNLGWCSLVEER